MFSFIRHTFFFLGLSSKSECFLHFDQRKRDASKFCSAAICYLRCYKFISTERFFKSHGLKPGTDWIHILQHSLLNILQWAGSICSLKPWFINNNRWFMQCFKLKWNKEYFLLSSICNHIQWIDCFFQITDGYSSIQSYQEHLLILFFNQPLLLQKISTYNQQRYLSFKKKL